MRKTYSIIYDKKTNTWKIRNFSIRKLVSGQTVVISKKTQNPIKDHRTGKIIGYDEEILGTGKISREGRKITIEGLSETTNLESQVQCILRPKVK